MAEISVLIRVSTSLKPGMKKTAFRSEMCLLAPRLKLSPIFLGYFVTAEGRF